MSYITFKRGDLVEVKPDVGLDRGRGEIEDVWALINHTRVATVKWDDGQIEEWNLDFLVHWVPVSPTVSEMPKEPYLPPCPTCSRKAAPEHVSYYSIEKPVMGWHPLTQTIKKVKGHCWWCTRIFDLEVPNE